MWTSEDNSQDLSEIFFRHRKNVCRSNYAEQVRWKMTSLLVRGQTHFSA